jgi:hypothetical protein
VTRRDTSNEMAQVCERTIADIQMTKERVARNANVNDEVHELRRRYVLNGTSQAELDSGRKESTKKDNWECRVVRGKWEIPTHEKEKRKTIAVNRCNRKALGNAINGRAKEKCKKEEPEIEEAIQRLKQLRITDPQESAVAVKGKKRRNQQQGSEGPKDKRIELEELWLEFTLAERIKHGWYEKMPNGGQGKCACGRASISYPHWPPSTKEEALRQFEYTMRNENEHRRNLVLRWWEHFNDFANMTPWTACERQGRYKEAAELIKEHSIIVQRELERSWMHEKRPKGWRCHEYCEIVISKKGVSCLCHCGQHRDQCPIHS